VGFPGGPRLEWYDRNPSDVSIIMAHQTVGPHTVTTRATYTVPAGKKAFVAATHCEMRRITAASSLGTAYIYFTWAATNGIVVSFSNNTVGAEVRDGLQIGSVLFTGQSLLIRTMDDSTGGTITYGGTAIITEFSA